MKKLFLLASTILVSLGLAMPVHAALITSAGSTTVQPPLKACSKAYKQSHSDLQFIFAGGGSSKGIDTVGRGRIDIGRASRVIKAKEHHKYPNLKLFKFATDGVVMVLHADNNINNLNADQVTQLFNGGATNWQQVGGSDGEVNLITLGTEHGTYTLFSKFFHLDGVESEGDILFSKGRAWIAFSQQVALDKVAHDRHAITFASVGVAQAYAASTGSVKLISLNNIPATEANISNGTYKMTRPLLLLTNNQPTGEVKKFIDFTLSSTCQDIVKEMGYIPVQ